MVAVARLVALMCLVIATAAAAEGCGGEETGERQDDAGRQAQPEPEPGAASVEDAPAAIRRYVDAVNGEDLEALVAAFHPDGEVIDVGRRIAGEAPIRRWGDAEVIGGRLTVLRVRETDAGAALNVRFAPGGTDGFEANYEFEVDSDRIRRATLTYA